MLRNVGRELIGRVEGPLSFRFILQPIVAVALAIRAGLKDARAGRPPHLWAIVHDPLHRRDLLGETWKEVRNVFILAVIIDVVYEFVVFRWVYPLQPFIVATLLAAVPYLCVRGLVNRLARRRRSEAEGRRRDAA